MRFRVCAYGLAIAALLCASLRLDAGRSRENGCTAQGCHAPLMRDSIKHSPAVDDCATCHRQDGAEHPGGQGKEFSLTDAQKALCTQCHAAEEKPASSHSPYEDGSCTSCHSPHSAPNPKLLLARTDDGAICASCHDLDDAKKRSRHKPVASGACLKCHAPHQSAAPKLLVKDEAALCGSCHSRLPKADSSASVHAPYKKFCTTCHEAHASEHSFLLRSVGTELCFSCHTAIRDRLQSDTAAHAALKEKRNCLGCHLPHAGRFGSLLRSEEKKLCYQCHSERKRSMTKTLPDIRSKAEAGTSKHAPVQDGCSGCHDAHSSPIPNLLLKAFPAGNYAKPDAVVYQLCFDCHDASLLDAQKAAETGFRNGDKSLHILHVGREKSIVCTSCHDVHGSNGAHIVAETARFGLWDMPLKYVPEANGGACTPGCHRALHYTR